MPSDSRLTGSKMGIRFYCPNGHRLHVKSFLAGKRGICPHCAARFRIPPDSQIPRGSPKIQPNSLAAASASPAGKKRSSGTAAMAAADSAKDSKPSSRVASPGVDPIEEAPEAVWYVRPPSGGQYGPAKGDVMRNWIAEGRVSADSLVWREGWADWLAAGPIFPSLNAAYTAPATSTVKREAISLQLQPTVSPSSGGSRPTAVAARSATKPKSLAAVIILGLIVVVLLALMVIVLTSKR
jgi:hypothetical protein